MKLNLGAVLCLSSCSVLILVGCLPERNHPGDPSGTGQKQDLRANVLHDASGNVDQPANDVSLADTVEADRAIKDLSGADGQPLNDINSKDNAVADIVAKDLLVPDSHLLLDTKSSQADIFPPVDQWPSPTNCASVAGKPCTNGGNMCGPSPNTCLLINKSGPSGIRVGDMIRPLAV